MAVAPQCIVDNSAWNRVKHQDVALRLRPLVEAGIVASCAPLEIEALYSAKNIDDYENLRNMRASIFTYLQTEEVDWQRALDVQQELVRKSQHRGIKIPDLLIAALAERHQLVLVHYDSDFDRIAVVTHQRTEWVVPRGTVS